LQQRQQHILPTHYFHVVFTLPSELRELIKLNRRITYGLLFSAASQTLLALGRDPKRLGALLGVTAVLHTWTRDLRFHPHLHCIVTGGGLSLDGERWVPGPKKYLFPRDVLGNLFRGKFLDALKRAYRKGALHLPRCLTEDQAFENLLTKLYLKKWQVYVKRPFAGAQHLFNYLGRYTHRVAISNHRIVEFDRDAVTIGTRGSGTATMTPETFIARFLQHILPTGFTKIRHFGLVAPSNVNSRLVQARAQLSKQQPSASNDTHLNELPTDDWRVLLKRLADIDLLACPQCGCTRTLRLIIQLTHPSASAARGPP